MLCNGCCHARAYNYNWYAVNAGQFIWMLLWWLPLFMACLKRVGCCREHNYLLAHADPHKLFGTYQHARNSLLHVTDLPMGKTAWTSFQNRRNLIEANSNSTLNFSASDLKDVMELRGVLISPLVVSTWCSFVGMIRCYFECWYWWYHYSSLLPYLILSYK